MSDEARREQILSAADRLLRHYGPQKTTVADVAREAGVGVGSVYLEFSSKEAIVEALSRSRYEAVLAAMQKAADAIGKRKGTFGKKLVAALDARLTTYFAQAESGAHACDLFHCSSSAVKTAAQQFYEDERALLASILQQGNACGELSVADPELSAQAILRAEKSFSPPFLFMGEREEVQRLATAMHEILLKGLLRR